MKALRFHRYGGPEVLQYDNDVPTPEPGEGEIQVQVSGAGVNPVDWKVREGHLQGLFPTPLPVIVAWEFSGTVSKLGPGVTRFQVGEEVYGISRRGTTADYAIARADTVAHKPVSMDLPDAASVPLCGQTAWQALFKVGELKAGQTVLVQAAAGGVGTFAVQFAKWKGAHVIGTASARNHHLLLEMGCDEVIDYRTTPYEDVIRDIDVVLESIGGEENMRKSLSVLKPGGILVSISSQEPTEAAAAEGKRAAYCFMQESADDLEQITSLIQDLRVRPILDAVVPYNRAIEAQKESQAGHVVGKLVVDVRR